MKPLPRMATSIARPVVSIVPPSSAATAAVAETPAAARMPSGSTAGTSTSPRCVSIAAKRTSARLNAGVLRLATLFDTTSSARCCARSPIAPTWKAPFIAPPARRW
jgi:hypothetical protein